MKCFLSILICLCVLCGVTSDVANSSQASPVLEPNNEQVSDRFAKFTWYGKGADGKDDLMLQASMSGQDGGNIMLTGNIIRGQAPIFPIRSFELQSEYAAVLVDLKVYRDTSKNVLYAVIDEGGASTSGVWVVGISTSAKSRTLFNQMNRGEPRFQVRNGVAEIREVWEIARLMNHGWHPTKDFDGHVLVERVYQLNKAGVFELKTIKPSTEDEKKLSKQEFQRMLSERNEFEREHP